MSELLMACLSIIPGGETVGEAVLTAVASEHVRRLGHPEYRVRETAGRELVRLGTAAAGPLRAAVTDPDAERAGRCREVLAQVEAADREAKLARLLAEPVAPPPDGLPCLTEFLKAAGDGREARRLYAGLYHCAGTALQTVQADSGCVGPLQDICAELRRLRQPNPVELREYEFAWLCFLAGRADPKAVRGVIEEGLSAAWWDRGAAELLRQAAPGSPLRRLFLAALERHRNHSSFWGGTGRLEAARMRDAVPVLLRIAANPDSNYNARVHALAVIAAVGDREAAREMRARPALFEDRSDFSVSTFPSDYGLPPVRIEPRDVALGVCAELEGRDLDELGFLSVPRAYHGPGPTPYKYAFLDGASRAAAFERWKKLPPDPK